MVLTVHTRQVLMYNIERGSLNHGAAGGDGSFVDVLTHTLMTIDFAMRVDVHLYILCIYYYIYTYTYTVTFERYSFDGCITRLTSSCQEVVLKV